MSIGKRILALAAAGAAALLVGGGVGVLHNAQPAQAAAPIIGAVGCGNTTDSTTITWATSPATGNLVSQIQSAPIPGGSLSLATPTGVTLCGVVLQDGDAIPGNDLVDSGSITATVSAPGLILESGQPNWSWHCGVPSTANSCSGVQRLTAGVIGPPAVNGSVGVVPGNSFHVALNPGSTFGIIGTATPIITVSARWLSDVGVAPFAFFQTPTVNIGIVAPAYFLAVSANPSTIPANLPTSTSTVGSVITAVLYHAATTSVCTTLIPGTIPTVACSAGGGIAGPAALVTGAAAILVPGAEPGVVTFSTNLGVFSSAGPAPAGPTLVSVTGAAQIVSAHCGTIPNTYPTSLIPTPGLVTGLTLNSCSAVSATLVGGGAAGTATVVVNYVADFTGVQALPQGAVTVNLTPGPITVPLTNGCNEVITPANLAGGANGAAVAALATGFNVQSIWVFNNATHTFAALFFAAAGAPTDISAVGPNQSVFVCGTGAGTFRVA